jgi:hypothetical protein
MIVTVRAAHHESMPVTTTAMAGCNKGPIPHGQECECMALAAAMGLDERAISFTFCRMLLQHHWSMRCRHGSASEAVELTPSSQRWTQHPPMTPVLAIILENA